MESTRSVKNAGNVSRTISIITFYNPNSQNVKNMLRVAKQSNVTIICDNSDVSNIKFIESNESGTCDIYEVFNNRIRYCPFYRNLGLSAAFNNVLKNTDFLRQDDDFVLFFDQDSVIPEDYAEKLKKNIVK